MRKPVKIALVVLFVAVAGFAMWEGLRTKEPVYQGKSLRAWLDEYYFFSGPNDGPKRDAAMGAIRAIGTNGIPTLLSMVRADDSAMKSKLRGFWSRHFSRNRKLPFWLRYPPWVRGEARVLNTEAFLGFHVLGENARQAVPALVEIFERSNSEWLRAVAPGHECIRPRCRRAGARTD